MSEGRRTNPNSGKTWTDDEGRVWRRRGKKWPPLNPRRVRSLIKNPDVLLATWLAFDVEWYDTPDAKKAALDRVVSDAAGHDNDLCYSEWELETGQRLLIVEQWC